MNASARPPCTGGRPSRWARAATPSWRLILWTASACAAAVLLLPSGRVAAHAPGRLAGTVRLTLSHGAPQPISAYSRRRAAFTRAPRQTDIRHVVVFVADARPSSAPATQRAVLTQAGEQFVPHVVAVTVGSTVEFPNEDPFFHNVFSLSGAATFDLGRYQPGESRSHRFTAPGLVKVFCHIHSQMSAIVRVFDHPWFTIPSPDGSFTLDGVPPGRHTVVAWHERIGEQRTTLDVAAGQITSVDFTLPVLEPEP